jgi:hypothetical protein
MSTGKEDGMRSRRFRRAIMIISAAVLFAVFTVGALTAGPISWAVFLLASAAIVFGYIITRLSGAMFAAEPRTRRMARRALIVAAAVPVLILTPTAIAATPREYASMILVASAVWLALALAFTSFAVASVKVAPAVGAPLRQGRSGRSVRRRASRASRHLRLGA